MLWNGNPQQAGMAEDWKKSHSPEFSGGEVLAHTDSLLK
jgi:hypothetical protein